MRTSVTTPKSLMQYTQLMGGTINLAYKPTRQPSNPKVSWFCHKPYDMELCMYYRCVVDIYSTVPFSTLITLYAYVVRL